MEGTHRNSGTSLIKILLILCASVQEAFRYTDLKNVFIQLRRLKIFYTEFYVSCMKNVENTGTNFLTCGFGHNNFHVK